MVAVTGHRVLNDADRVAAGVDGALDEIARAYPGRSIQLVSSLAEGADRLVSRKVLAQPGGRLIAALPLAADDYAKDFQTEESRREFKDLLEAAAQVVTLPPQPTREAAYEAAGLYGLDHAAVVVAIWDGQSARGRGGTPEIVTHARERQLPLAWVHAGSGRLHSREAASAAGAQSQVTLENWPTSIGTAASGEPYSRWSSS